MANRIQTSSKVVDLFGPGKHGFGDDPDPLLATAFDAAWCNGVQEELIRIIEYGNTKGIGVAPDGAIFDQVLTALRQWVFDLGWTVENGGTATLEDSSALVIEGDGGMGGSTLTAGTGSTCTFNGAVIVGGTGSFTCNASATFNNPATFTQGATISASQTLALLGDADISGGAGSQIVLGSGSLVDTDNLAVTEIRFDASGTTLPGTPGYARWNDTFFSFTDGANVVRTFDEPARGFDLSFTTAATAADTAATAGRRIKHNEPVWIEMSSRFESDTAADTFNYIIKVTGPLGNANIMVDNAYVAVANVGYHMHTFFVWTPTDTWPAEVSPQNYVFTARLGIASGNLTADRVGIKVSSNIEI